jgi:hypothetical protein
VGFRPEGWTKEESSRDDGALWVCLLKGHGEGHVEVREFELCRVKSSRVVENFDVSDLNSHSGCVESRATEQVRFPTPLINI